MASIPIASNNESQHRLFIVRYARRLRTLAVIAGCVYLVLLAGVVWRWVDTTQLGIFGLSVFGSIVVEWIISVAISSIVVAVLVWKLYFSPRSAAYEGGSITPSRVKILAGRAQLVLCHPNETYVFLKHKRVAGITGENGGEQLIFPAFGEEAIGPVSLATEMLPWTDKHVLTREAQPLEIALGVQWRVADPEKYAFRIASEVHRDAAKMTADFSGSSRLASENTVIDPRRPATSWLYLWVESAVRSYVSRLGMADMVVSAASLQWLNLSAGEGSRTNAKFDEMAEEVVRSVNKKATDYGLAIESVSVQGIKLPQRFQDAIDRTREAFLKPIASEQEMKARQFEVRGELEVLKNLLGDDAFRMNELLKNFRGANFGYFPFQDVINKVAGQVAAAAAAGATPELPANSSNSGLARSNGPDKKSA
jgi:regulator of protease activity HflC (stomatin/prohibitin superfamily)